MEDVQSILHDCWNYNDTVGFFAVLYEALQKRGLNAEVERDFIAPDGTPKTPDFAVLDGDEITDVLEHKASLQRRDRALALLTEAGTKYAVLQINGVESKPLVTVFYPTARQNVIDEIAKQLPRELTLCGFDQKTSDTQIRFELHGSVRSAMLRNLLKGDPLVYDPTLVYSKYKFIRAEPPVIYTAFEVWRQLLTLQSIKSIGKPEFAVSKDALGDRLQRFYSPWIRNLTQVTNPRMTRALEFLKLIDFIGWERDKQEIVVYTHRGRRSGDHLRYFAERLAALRQRGVQTVSPSVAEGQRTLFDHFGPQAKHE